MGADSHVEKVTILWYDIHNSTTSTVHSEKKGYQNGAPGVLLLQMVPFFQRGTLFSLIIMFVEKRVPLQCPSVTGAPK